MLRLAPREVPQGIEELDPLQRGSLVHGRAIDADGKPLAGWRVEFVGLGAPWFDVCTVRDDGAFVLPNLPGSVGRLLLWSKEHGHELPMLVEPSVLPDSGPVELRLSVAPDSLGVLQVAVLAPPGVSAKGLKVRAWQEATPT